jgi:hypothetical protein
MTREEKLWVAVALALFFLFVVLISSIISSVV